MNGNLPPGVTENDLPGWNDPDPLTCRCGEDVMPGDECDFCGEKAPTEADMKEAAEEDAAERQAEARRGL